MLGNISHYNQNQFAVYFFSCQKCMKNKSIFHLGNIKEKTRFKEKLKISTLPKSCCCLLWIFKFLNWDWFEGDSCAQNYSNDSNGIHGKEGEKFEKKKIEMNCHLLFFCIHPDLWPYSTVQQLGIKYAYNLLGENYEIWRKKCVYLTDIYLYCFCAYFTLVFFFF